MNVFGVKSVDSAIAAVTKAIDDLQEVMAHHTVRASMIEDHIESLKIDKEAHEDERDRAVTIMNRFKALIAPGD
jgi:hypothetical protein